MTAAGVAAAPAPARRDSSLLLLCALLLAAVALRPQLVGAGPLIPDIQDDLGTSHSVAGLVGTIPVLSMGVFAPLAGLVAARWGLRAAMAGCLLGIALFGLGRSVAPGAAVLLALTLPVGIGMAIAGTLLPVAVKQRFAHRPAFASGIGTTGINIGAAISSAVAVPIASAWEGWRGALAVFSFATLAIFAGWLVLSRGSWTERSTARRPRLPIRRPIAWMIVLAFALPSIVYYGLVAWIADAYIERGWSEQSAGAVLAVMGIAAIPAGLIVPWLADRMGSRRTWMWFAASCMATATFGFAALPGGAFGWAVLTGFALGTVFPMCLTMCLDVAHEPGEAGAAAALMFLAGYPVAALGPLGAGAMRDLTGSFDASLWAFFGTALLMAVVMAPLSPERLRPAAERGLMDRGVAVALAAVIGGTLALQAPLNSLLGRSVGGLTASVVAFSIGLFALLSVSVIAGGLGGVVHAFDAPWWALIGGGLISALYVASIVWTVRALGAGGLTAATIAGQFAVAMVVDHFGWLGVERSPITISKLAGLALLAAGTWLVVRD